MMAITEEKKVNIDKQSLLKALREYFGFHSFKGKQEEAIRALLEGNDVFVLMPTGGGKSLCYQLPALLMDGTAIIISPLIALMKNQVDLFRSFMAKDSYAHFLNSSLSTSQRRKVLEDLESGRTKLLYIAPETLGKEETLTFLKNIKISFVAVDEAHCISEWGHDFRPDYRNIRPMIDSLEQGRIPIMALTATATPKVRLDIVKNLGMKDPLFVIDSFNRPNLYYEVRQRPSKEQLIKQVIQIVREHEGQQGIVYCLLRKTTEEVAEILQANGIKAEAYHAGLGSKERSLRQDRFLNDETQVIVATIAFGLGIDKPDIRFVIHYDFPKSLESYYQETGRAGRDGLPAKCIAFFSYTDIVKQEQLLRKKSTNEREVGYLLLEEVVGYVETGICRRKYILNYFGEKYPHDRCDNCDNCVHPRKEIDITNDMKLILRTIKETGGKHRALHIINIIRGKNTYEVKQYEHHKVPTFGKGKDKDSYFWHAIIRKGVVDGLIKKEIENYGVLKVTEQGEEFFKNPVKITIQEPRTYEAGGVSLNSQRSVLDPVLLDKLRMLRKKMAKERGIPPYVIFQDPTLEEMATYYPITIKELTTLQGVTKAKAEKYGKQFIDLIKKHVEEHEIERPMDFSLKQKSKKSKLRINILNSIDKRIPLYDIAELFNISYKDLLTELERMAMAGNKINIDYFIDEVMDPSDEELIYDYFMNSETEDIQEALKHLEKYDITEEMIRLIKIKIFSEMST